MVFNISTVNLINALFIAVGIGVCGLCFLQISASAHLRKEVRRYFQVFFLLILLYISTHLARQLMNGLQGGGVRTALQAVTLVEFLASGFMSYMISMLVLTVARAEERQTKLIERVLPGYLCVHALLLIIGAFCDLIYYFDATNVYHRAPGYLLSNLCPLLMLVTDIFLLVRYHRNIGRLVKTAFWIYLIAPIVAIVIQSFSYGIQFIIFATVGAAVYMFSVIVRDQNEQYEKQRMERSRLDTELSMASSIQADMLPNIFPAYPERSEFEIYASMDPAKEVGGDFYDYFFVDDDHLGIVMADVSGKGVPAALFMMISKILVQNYAMAGRGVKETMEAVNHQICANNREEMFVTVWLGILEISTGRLTAANAGHEYPALRHACGPFELVKDKHGFVIGGMDGVKYREYELQMTPGSKLFLYTDGVPEATDANKELFGTERMLSALNTDPDAAPEDILKNVRAAVDAFVKDAEQFDDLTMLCVEYRGTE